MTRKNRSRSREPLMCPSAVTSQASHRCAVFDPGFQNLSKPTDVAQQCAFYRYLRVLAGERLIQGLGISREGCLNTEPTSLTQVIEPRRKLMGSSWAHIASLKYDRYHSPAQRAAASVSAGPNCEAMRLA
eukprot:3984136-Pyramimonas_sp.AAC.1